MIRFCLIMVAVCVTTGQLFAQTRNVGNDQIVYDIHGMPIFMLEEIDGQTVVNYFPHLKISPKVDFIGGREALQAYCDSLYFTKVNYLPDYPMGVVHYTILFDEKLKIKEIRFIFNTRGDDYNELVKEVLMQTQGRWQKTETDDKKWLMFWGRYTLR